MKNVFCYVEPSADLLSQMQLLVYWSRAWKEAGFNPYVLTPNDLRDTRRSMEEVELNILRSGSSPHMFRRWWAIGGSDPVLMVEPNVLPNCKPDDIPEWNSITVFSPFAIGMMHFRNAMANLCYAYGGTSPFTDIDILKQRLTGKIAVKTVENNLFTEWPVEQLLEQRKARLV